MQGWVEVAPGGRGGELGGSETSTFTFPAGSFYIDPVIPDHA